MGDDSSSDVAAAAVDDDDPSVTAVADEPAVTRERAPEIKPGDLLAGRYQIEAVIGKGGSGVVLRAYDRVSATVVAVKVLKPGLSHDPRWEKRFQRELRLGRPVRHPNVCRIFDIADDSDGYRFLTMEYATGGTLRDLIKTNQSLRPLEDRLADAASAIAGLAAIHAAGIVHRDVKPDNILRMDDGRLVLSDFGLATDLPNSTMVSVFVGTPHYMAPEVREGDPATARSDVWSLGVVLHEIFFGKRPEKKSVRSVSGVSRTSKASTSSTIERAMLALCTRCLANDPADRPEDARAVQRLFDTSRRSPHAVLRSRRGRLLWLASSFAAMTAMVAIAATAYRRSHPIAEPVSPGGIRRVVPTGEPADWSTVAVPLTTVPGPVHCFSLLDQRTVRLVWGAPRTAEDVDTDAGIRRPAQLVTEAYAVGCPELSPDGKELLFTANTPAGGTEIRRSARPDGAQATSVATGSHPVWLRNGEEFAYSIDAAHAAIFSLPTMKFRLLHDADLPGTQMIVGKAASSRSDAVALMVYGSELQWELVVYSGPSLDKAATFAVPGSRRLRFGSIDDRIFLSPLEQRSPLAAFDWHRGVYRNIGRYGDLEVVDVLSAGRVGFLLGRRRKDDVWLYGPSGRTRLTTDGNNVDAAISPTGELLVVKSGAGGAIGIWSQTRAGLHQQTHGRADTSPDFSPDGRSWVYADLAAKSLMICATGGEDCRTLLRDDLLPALPRFSPDGSKVAYIRQGGAPRLIVLSIADGKSWSLGDTHWQCPPVWSSATAVWAFEGSARHYRWVEREIEGQRRTGRRIDVNDDQSAVNDELDCWPPDADADSPFYRKLRVEKDETASVLRLPRTLLD
jgi:Tol biopolymer transport system component